MIRFELGEQALHFDVLVFDTLADAHEHFRRFREPAIRHNDPAVAYDWTACVRPIRKVWVNRRGRVTRKGDRIGVIYLARPTCTTEVVGHEVVHASLDLYREAQDRPANFGYARNNRNTAVEEDFAHIFGRLLRKMTNKLYDYGVWEQAA